ncbi:ankyrin repeat-containing domain protein [Xylariaceae sp. FL1019]|nr:ankyrin repeat-containing domain protein [Xylariaceae sp. FL1019]
MELQLRKPTESQWFSHKEIIRRYYIEDGLSLDQLIKRLASLGLTVTPSQLEYQLKKWKLRKNIDKKTWLSIDHRIKKRKQQGKESEVIHCGKRVKTETVKKETDRHRDTSIFAQLGLQSSAASPSPGKSDVIVCTPEYQYPQITLPETLPWLQFLAKHFRPMILTPMPMARVTKDDLYRSLASSMVNLINWMCRESHLSVCESRISSMWEATMPECFPKEHLRHTLTGSDGDLLPEIVLPLIYTISNAQGHFLQYPPNWETSFAIIRQCGLLRINLRAVRLTSYTIDSFLNHVYEMSLRLIAKNVWANNPVIHDSAIIEVIRWLLESGQNPDTKFIFNGFGTTALEAALVADNLALAECLLDAGANILPVSHGAWLRAITIAKAKGHCSQVTVIELLLHNLARVSGRLALPLAIRLGNARLVQESVDTGASLCAGSPARKAFLYEETALSLAAGISLEMTKLVLRLISATQHSGSLASVVTADVLISAAVSGHDDIIRFLQPFSDGSFANCYGITPLHAAARQGHLSTCQLLLPLYDSHVPTVLPLFTPLHLASYGGHDSVVSELIVHRHDVNAILGQTGPLPHPSDVRSLYNADYDKERHCQIRCFRPLDMTLTGGYLYSRPCATMLIHAGARLHGYEVAFAAGRLDLHLLAALLEAGGDPNERNEKRWTALQCALGPHTFFDEWRECDVVELLLQRGAQLVGGEVARAITLKKWKLVDLLVRHGGSLDDVDANGASVLETLITTSQSLEAAQWLEIRPLHYDAGALCASLWPTSDDAIVQQLLRNRAFRLPSSDQLEVTALGLAAQLGKIDVLQELLKSPPLTAIGPVPSSLDPDPDSIYTKSFNRRIIFDHPLRSPLALAARGRGAQAVECALELLRRGYRLDELAWVALADSDNLALARALCDIGQTNENFKQAIDATKRYKSFKGHPDGKTIENLALYNPLLGAVRHHNKELVHLLIDMGVNVNEHNIDLVRNRSPLQLATKLGDFDMVKLLLKRGADPNVPGASSRGATALQLAAIKGYLGIAMYLIEHGAEVNASPSRKHGRTVLEGAAEWGKIDMLELMLRNGALMTGSWRWHYIRAVKLATNEHFHTAARLLKEAGNWSSEDQRIYDTTSNWEKIPRAAKSDEERNEWSRSEFSYNSDSEDEDEDRDLVGLLGVLSGCS